MKLDELRKIILNSKYAVEVYKNDFIVMNDYIRINDIMTLHDIDHIDIVGVDKTDDDEITVWFNNHRINLNHIKSLEIAEIRSYLL